MNADEILEQLRNLTHQSADMTSREDLEEIARLVYELDALCSKGILPSAWNVANHN